MDKGAPYGQGRAHRMDKGGRTVWTREGAPYGQGRTVWTRAHRMDKGAPYGQGRTVWTSAHRMDKRCSAAAAWMSASAGALAALPEAPLSATCCM